MKRTVIRAFIYALMTTTTLTACATSQFTIESDPPGADIVVVSNGGVKQKIGQTPMTVNASQQPTIFANDAQIQISKDGFRSESYLLPPSASGSSGRLQAKLVDDPVTKACQDSATTITEATDAVAQIQRMLYKKSYPDAERALNGYVIKFPTVPVFFSLLGNVHYLQKELDKALDAYRRANALQPQNLETSRMIEKIKAIRGPSGGAT
jgi:tetratricopeptide (TPR) repeat protein